MAVASQGCRWVPYCRRHPEQTVLYQVVQQPLETYLALAGEDDCDGQRVPAYVEREFRRYLFHASGDPGVAVGRFQTDLAEPGADHIDLDAGFQQMDRRGVALMPNSALAPFDDHAYAAIRRGFRRDRALAGPRERHDHTSVCGSRSHDEGESAGAAGGARRSRSRAIDRPTR